MLRAGNSRAAKGINECRVDAGSQLRLQSASKVSNQMNKMTFIFLYENLYILTVHI